MNPPHSYEGFEIDLKAVIRWAGILTAALAVTLGSSALLYRAWHPRPSLSAGEQLRQIFQVFPEPRLQVDEARDRAALEELESQLLTEYAWVNRKQGIVRIPIERAMELFAERGR